MHQEVVMNMELLKWGYVRVTLISCSSPIFDFVVWQSCYHARHLNNRERVDSIGYWSKGLQDSMGTRQTRSQQLTVEWKESSMSRRNMQAFGFWICQRVNWTAVVWSHRCGLLKPSSLFCPHRECVSDVLGNKQSSQPQPLGWRKLLNNELEQTARQHTFTTSGTKRQ